MPSIMPMVPVLRLAYSQIICLLACGGLDCRYERPACWMPSQQTVQGLYSHWVTDDIWSMARSSSHIKKYSIIEQLNIKSIINMLSPGEHAHCGPPLQPDTGFTYFLQTFMENDNFGVSSVMGMMDGVKMLTYGVKEGKVAVHCCASLERTGVGILRLIACHQIYTLRVSSSEMVHYVHIKRPRRSARCLTLSVCWALSWPSTLTSYLHHQVLLFHGQEARTLRHTPKVSVLCNYFDNTLFILLVIYFPCGCLRFWLWVLNFI
uniref:Tyrosine specific protein phosphatases domain-containing protein n=1 Tax=Salmo trutta TaxID=8032 RepID=A0A673XIY6_SALTR